MKYDLLHPARLKQSKPKGITRTMIIHGRMQGQGEIGGKVKGKTRNEAN